MCGHGVAWRGGVWRRGDRRSTRGRDANRPGRRYARGGDRGAGPVVRSVGVWERGGCEPGVRGPVAVRADHRAQRLTVEVGPHGHRLIGGAGRGVARSAAPAGPAHRTRGTPPRCRRCCLHRWCSWRWGHQGTLILSFPLRRGIPAPGHYRNPAANSGGSGGHFRRFPFPVLSFYVNDSSMPGRSQAIPPSFPTNSFPGGRPYWATRRNGGPGRMAGVRRTRVHPRARGGIGPKGGR